jgi:hypothetical protein
VSEQVLSELCKLAEGLAVRVSLLDEGTARYFEKDRERLRALIDRLSRDNERR